jgi:hypothetical protein
MLPLFPVHHIYSFDYIVADWQLDVCLLYYILRKKYKLSFLSIDLGIIRNFVLPYLAQVTIPDSLVAVSQRAFSVTFISTRRFF